MNHFVDVFLTFTVLVYGWLLFLLGEERNGLFICITAPRCTHAHTVKDTHTLTHADEPHFGLTPPQGPSLEPPRLRSASLRARRAHATRTSNISTNYSLLRLLLKIFLLMCNTDDQLH